MRVRQIRLRHATGMALMMITMPISSQASRPSPEARELNDARRAAEQARQRANALEKQAKAAIIDADRSRAQRVAAAAAVQASEAEIAAVKARMHHLDRQRAVQRQRLAQQQGPIIRLTGALQTMARRPGALVLLQPGSLQDLIRVRMLLASTTPQIRTRTASLRAEIGRSEALVREAERAVLAVQAGRRELARRQGALARLEMAQRQASQRFIDSAMLEEDRAIAMGEKARDITDLIGRLGDQAILRTRLAALPGPVLRPPVPGEAPTPANAPIISITAEAPPAYRLPVVGKLISGMGEVSDAGVRAKGLTLAPAAGALTVSPADGRVAYAGPFRSYAGIVIIDHDHGWTSLITGLGALTVRPGEAVSQGSPIGRAETRQPRITIELRHAGQPIEIIPLLRAE